MIDLPPQTISEILNQLAQGDDKVATRLYRHYHGFLFAYIRHRIPDDAGAEDVAHDVFLSVFQKPQAFAGQSKFSTWLCGIAKFKMADWWRKQKREFPVDDVEDEVLQAEPDPNWDFVARLESKQDAEAVRLCIDKLSVDQREAVFWIFYQDEGLEKVAQHQNCPVGTVKSRLSTVRKRMQNCLSGWIKGGRYA